MTVFCILVELVGYNRRSIKISDDADMGKVQTIQEFELDWVFGF
jgi:hypothetical protein